MKRVCLIVMDGWGINPRKDGNAVAAASTPNLARLFAAYPATCLETSGFSVGLPPGQMGNSEVGHLTMGAGRVIYQELTRITKAVETGDFRKNPRLLGFIDAVKSNGGRAHLMGLVSDGGVHSHITHLFAAIDALKDAGIKEIYIHAFLDGRDTPPMSGALYLKELGSYIQKAGAGKIATVSGRYFAMDRDKRWERVKKAYDALVLGEGVEASDPVAAVEEAYKNGETDEFITPVVITGGVKAVARIADNDGVFFFNFRADRAREITQTLTSAGFNGFKRLRFPKLSAFLCMTEYDAKLKLPVVFPAQPLGNILGAVLSGLGLKQFRVSETEKYAHVTFFFNGGREEPFPGEERVLIPSVKDVPTYDKKPEMRAKEIADAAVERIESGDYHFMLMNFANGDMVGHTGVREAAVKAVEAVDEAVGRVVKAALEKGWKAAVTSDHGNAEQMTDYQTGEPHTAHTTNAVPFVLIDDELKGVRLKSGSLKDIAPTVLKLMDIKKPAEMDGTPLF